MTDTPAPVDLSPEAVESFCDDLESLVNRYDSEDRRGTARAFQDAQAVIRALRLSLTARDRVLQQCEAALAGAVMGKPVMLGPVLTEVRAILAGVRT